MARRQDFDDLYGVDLSKLELDHIELDEDRPSHPFWRWLALLALLGLGALVLWFPSSSYYAAHGHSSWLFFTICGAAAVVGIAVGRWLWTWVQELATTWARRPLAPKPEEPPRPPSALRRWLTLLVVIGGIAAILVGLPASGAMDSPGAVSGVWFLAAIGAIVVGVLGGRWLLMQAQAHAEKQGAPRAPIRWPPWFKWVTLFVLVAVGVGAILAPLFVGGQVGESLEFTLGGVGLAVGIVGAIWLARRFEEAEDKLRKRKRDG